MLTYSHAAATAYLDVVRGHEKGYDGILLCEVHAQRFSAPRGWSTVDRRPGIDDTRDASGTRLMDHREDRR
jgi:hypothetical protein